MTEGTKCHFFNTWILSTCGLGSQDSTSFSHLFLSASDSRCHHSNPKWAVSLVMDACMFSCSSRMEPAIHNPQELCFGCFDSFTGFICNCLYYRDAQKMLLVVADDKILQYTTRYPSSLCIVSWPTPPVFARPLDYIPSQPWELSMQHAELGLSSRLQDELTVQDPSILSK